MDIRKAASIAERAVVTFVTAFVGVYVMSGLNVHILTDASVLQKAESAGLAALGSLFLSLLGGNLGSKSSPSLLPQSLDPVADPTSQQVKDALNEHAAILNAHADVLDALQALPAEANPLHGLHPLAEDPSIDDGAVVIETRQLPLHPKLGRHVRHDPRSRQYAIPELPARHIQSQRWLRRVPIFDQGNLGSCTGNAAAGWLATDDSTRTGLVTLPDGSSVDEKLAVSIYSAATKVDSYSGSYPPDDTGSDGISVAKVLQTKGLAQSYQHAFSVQAVYSALQSGPGFAGTTWYNSMFNPSSDGKIPVDKASGVAGGHEYVISRIDVTNGTVTKIWMDNSWGPSWGVNGSAWFDPADFTALLADQGDFTVPIAVAPVPVPPTPPSPEATFQEAIDATPGLDSWLGKQAAHHKMTVPQYVAWKLAGSAGLR